MKKFIHIFLISILFLSIISVISCAKSENPALSENIAFSDITENMPTDEKAESEDILIPEKGEKISLKIPAPSISNNIINEETEQGIAIYLPPSYYVTEQRYPVVYFLPGFGDSHDTYMNSISNYMNDLLAEQTINEMIIVTINGNNKLGGSFYANSPVTGNWEDFVVNDVVTYIDENYRTIKSADARGISGHSMGGFGAINIAMNTKDIFGYIYSMSPGLFDENGLSKSPMSFKTINNRKDKYMDMDDDTARTEYLNYAAKLSWSTNFSFAYGSAFAGDPQGKAPYIKLPEQDTDGNFLQDDIWNLYFSGYGNPPGKLDACVNNLLSLKGFIIEYGSRDEFKWIPEGCEYFSNQLNERNILHTLISYEGDHNSLILKRIKEEVLPYFSKTLK